MAVVSKFFESRETAMEHKGGLYRILLDLHHYPQRRTKDKSHELLSVVMKWIQAYAQIRTLHMHWIVSLTETYAPHSLARSLSCTRVHKDTHTYNKPIHIYIIKTHARMKPIKINNMTNQPKKHIYYYFFFKITSSSTFCNHNRCLGLFNLPYLGFDWRYDDFINFAVINDIFYLFFTFLSDPLIIKNKGFLSSDMTH